MPSASASAPSSSGPVEAPSPPLDPQIAPRRPLAGDAPGQCERDGLGIAGPGEAAHPHGHAVVDEAGRLVGAR